MYMCNHVITHWYTLMYMYHLCLYRDVHKLHKARQNGFTVYCPATVSGRPFFIIHLSVRDKEDLSLPTITPLDSKTAAIRSVEVLIILYNFLIKQTEKNFCDGITLRGKIVLLAADKCTLAKNVQSYT